jgi:hypothetical protein
MTRGRRRLLIALLALCVASAGAVSSCRQSRPDVCGLQKTTDAFGIDPELEEHQELLRTLRSLGEGAASAQPRDVTTTCQTDWTSQITEGLCPQQVQKYCRSQCRGPEQLEECLEDDSGALKRCLRASLGPFKRAHKICGELVLEGRTLKTIDRSRLPPAEKSNDPAAADTQPAEAGAPPLGSEPLPDETAVPTETPGGPQQGPDGTSEPDEPPDEENTDDAEKREATPPKQPGDDDVEP